MIGLSIIAIMIAMFVWLTSKFQVVSEELKMISLYFYTEDDAVKAMLALTRINFSHIPMTATPSNPYVSRLIFCEEFYDHAKAAFTERGIKFSQSLSDEDC